MDLKSIAKDVEDEALSSYSPSLQRSNLGNATSLRETKQAKPSLTELPEHPRTASDKPEITMADETDTTTNTDAAAIAEVPVQVKKQPKVRTKEAAAEKATGEVSQERDVASSGSTGKLKRGRKAKPSDGAVAVKRAPLKRGPKPKQTPPSVHTPAVDEIADLLQLEEENQRLRKLLGEKLRAENIDLRKRLNLD